MKYFLFFTIILGAYSSSIAQVSTKQFSLVKYEQKAKAETEQMNLLLHFSKEQQSSILVINKRYYAQLAKLANQKLTLAERKKLLTSIESQRENDLKKILTVKQYQLCISKLAKKKARSEHLHDSLNTVRRH